MSMTHRPHLPRRGIAGIIHRRHRADGEPTIEIEPVTDDSIHAWLNTPNTGPDDLAGVSRMPFTVQPALSPSAPLLPAGRTQVTVYRELDDDEAFAERLLAMERDAHSVADFLAADFDARMEKLLARSRRFGKAWGTAVSLLERGWEATEALLASVLVTRRRKAAITPLVLDLGQLVATGDVEPETAARVMGLRRQYLHATDMPSERLPMLTPELLAELDAQKASAS